MDDDASNREVPAPLGWCSWCLEEDKFTQAATMQAGTALCVDCCKSWHRNQDEMQAEMERRQRETVERLSGFPGRPMGF